MDKELVVHPKHYNKADRRECWDEMMELFGPSAVVMFDVLSAYKYYYRAGSKENNPEEQDLEKIKVYMEHAQRILENNILSENACDCFYNMRTIIFGDDSTEEE